jgi:hypothetical protein
VEKVTKKLLWKGTIVSLRAFRNIQYSIFTLGLALVALSLMASVCFAIDLPKTAKLLPPHTVTLIDIDNYGRLKEQFDKTSVYRFYKEPEMAAFVENAKTKWRDSLKEMDENNMFKAIFETDVEPQGRLALAWVPDEQPKDANQMPVIVITQWGPNIDKIKETVAGVMEKNIEMGGHIAPSEDFRGVTIETAVDEKDTPLSFCFIDDCFISSLSLETLRFIIAQLKGASTPTLAEDPDYSATMRAVGPDSSLTLFVNIKQSMKMAVAEDSKGHFQAALTSLGLDNVSSLGASLELAKEPRTPYSIKALLKINGSKKGLCKIFDADPAPLRLPSFIPADVYRLSVLNLDAKKTYDELSSVLTAFGPAAASILYNPLVPASPDGRPAIMLKEDVINHLGDQVVVAQSLKKPFPENQFPAEYIIAIATTNRSALEKSLAAWHSAKIAPDDPDAKRELLGHTLYLIKPGRIPLFQGPGGARPMVEEQPKPAITIPTLAFTVTDTHLICGLESSVEKAVRTSRTGDSLSDARWFSLAKAALPPRTGMVSLEDTRATFEFLWWLMKQSRKDPGAAGLAAPTASYIFSDLDLDFTLLPDFEKVSKYFGLTASYVISRDDGFYMELTGLDQP